MSREIRVIAAGRLAPTTPAVRTDGHDEDLTARCDDLIAHGLLRDMFPTAA